MLDYSEFKNEFDEVIAYSQMVDKSVLNTEKLLKTWGEAKESLYHKFGDKLIVNLGHYVLEKPKETIKEGVLDWLDSIPSIVGPSVYYADNSRQEIQKLVGFVRDNIDSFGDNIVTVPCNGTYGIAKVGMKLTRAFKCFIKDKIVLDTIQTSASQLIQQAGIEGELCISIHPLDFLSSSENIYNWHSCHSLDGCYRTGNLSYMMDSSTVVCYLKGESDEEKLPNFPSSVLWNSKKWRMLLFFSENHTCLFAGRQYPMDLGYKVLHIITDSLSTLDFCKHWSRWHDDQINEYHYKIGTNEDQEGMPDSTSIKKPHVIINGYIYKLSRLISDESRYHYNDLLLSSCYTPRYCWAKVLRTVPSFKIGGEVPCLICGEETAHDSDIMFCLHCATENGGLEGTDYVACGCCGEGVSRDDAYWCEIENQYICPDCRENHYTTCDSCGDLFPIDEIQYNEENDCYLCSSCLADYNSED